MNLENNQIVGTSGTERSRDPYIRRRFGESDSLYGSVANLMLRIMLFIICYKVMAI